MPTLITAVLDQSTLHALLDELTPLRVGLDEKDDDRFFVINQPDLIEFVAGTGVRIRTSARMQWTLAGLAIPIKVNSATFLLEPWLSPTPHVGRLNFRLQVEQIDLKNVPDLVDEQVTLRANEHLAKLGETLGWSFGETLKLQLPMPPMLEPVEAFTLEAGSASVEVLADALRLVVALPMHFRAHAHQSAQEDARAAEPAGPPAPRAAEAPAAPAPNGDGSSYQQAAPTAHGAIDPLGMLDAPAS